MKSCLVAFVVAVMALVSLRPVGAQPEGILKGVIRKIDPAIPSVTLPVNGKDREFTIVEETRVFGFEKQSLRDRLKSFKVGDEVFFKPANRDGKDTLIGIKHVEGGPGAAPAVGPNFDASKLKPLTDMGADKYQGFAGGLYPGSNQRPAQHEKSGLVRAQLIQPLDAAGKAADQGKIVLLSLGMSNTSQASDGFAKALAKDSDKNPRLVFVNGAQGGMTASRIMNPDEPQSGVRYWKTVDDRLKAAGVTPAQVQAVWIKQADAGPTQGFPQYAKTLQSELATIARVLPKRFPNIQTAYFSSRTYAGYAKSMLNPEPYAFESGYSVKWLIEDQLNGAKSLNFDPALGPVLAPWLSWGPYLWSNGPMSRADGFHYRDTDFAADGTHHSAVGSEKIGQEMLRFFKTDTTTRPWFVAKP